MTSDRVFHVEAPFGPAGDQGAAIDALSTALATSGASAVLRGATGTGKTFTAAKTIERLGLPTLVLAPNKTLAAQLTSELRAFLPGAAVEYFVSYYDYYRPEAYVVQSDTYVEKDSRVNAEIDRLRHRATSALLSRRDVVVVASVSCIYGLGPPDVYRSAMLTLRVGERPGLRGTMSRLVALQYARNDVELSRGRFRVRGDVLDVFGVDAEAPVRIEFFGDEVERIGVFDPATGTRGPDLPSAVVVPSSHHTAPPETVEAACTSIRAELGVRLAELRDAGRLLEAQRLEQRTEADLEMLGTVGFCSGVENYSRHFDGRSAGQPPYTLLDYFPPDRLVVVDESHVTVPQLAAMAASDRSRKEALVEHGFRLPSALDNRPLTFVEVEARLGRTLFLSATPAAYELGRSQVVAEQLIRPTGVVDPEVVVRPSAGQVDDLLAEIRRTTAAGGRTLVTVLTRRLAEDLSDHLLASGVRAGFLHSDVGTLQRVETLDDLRSGAFDVLVGVNLLREGLDLPEVATVAVLDADREGFLRSEVALVQTIGRAARNAAGRVVLYADTVTPAMRAAIAETDRRRAVQEAYNVENGVVPVSAVRPAPVRTSARAGSDPEGPAPVPSSPAELAAELAALETRMREAASRLEFELAASLRDEANDLRRLLAAVVSTGS